MNGIIFDIDGTLVDSVDLHAQSWKEALEHFGHRVSFTAVRSQIGKGGDQLIPVFLSRDEVESKGEALEKFRSELFKRRYMPAVRAFPRVRDLFARLRADGWRVALASSAKRDELETYKRLCGVEDLVDVDTSSDDAEKSKPHPDIFQAALSKLELTGESCLIVGDSPYDAEAAKKAGVQSIGVLCGGFRAEDLTAAGFMALYESPADLLQSYAHSPLARMLNARAE